MESVIQNIAEEQRKEGHEVRALTSLHGARGRPRSESLAGVFVRRLKGIRLYYPDLTYPVENAEEILEGSDIVHVHSQNSLFNLVLSSRAEKLGKPIVADFLAVNYLERHNNFLVRIFGSRYQKFVQSKVLQSIDRAITLNERDYKALKEGYGVTSEIVPHGLPRKYFEEPRREGLFSEKHGIRHPNIATYVGRIHPSKGLDVLIKAIPLVADEVDDFLAIIAGSGSESYRRTLNQLARKLAIESKVRIMGHISEDEKISLLDSSRVFVFPTRHFGEAYPLIIDEAYARGLPIIATRAGAIPYKIEDMETGMLIPPEDSKSLGKAMVSMLRNYSLYKKMQRRVRKTRQGLLTWGQVVEKLDVIYEDLLEG